ncbi:hypothetical protein SORBI_3003G036000 [Sorghum bicolor]|uniref:Malic enzyme n=1 Tax=Sorghum bicolor TaxID=4558 RepID=A0A1W0VVP6_SORBI|nr:hypothetical protein SORBI_3003G036000 [Sorghum bicolor]
MRARLGGSASAATLGEPCAAGGGVYSPRRGARGKEEPAAESSYKGHGAPQPTTKPRPRRPHHGPVHVRGTRGKLERAAPRPERARLLEHPRFPFLYEKIPPSPPAFPSPRTLPAAKREEEEDASPVATAAPLRSSLPLSSPSPELDATMMSARTAAASPASAWKRGGGRSEGGGSSCDGCRTYRNTLRRRAAAAKVRAVPPKRVEAVAMGSAAETETQEEVEVAATGGVVEDPYGEDSATEELPVTPWAFSVASGYTLLRDPHHNKGLAFTEKERDAHYLRGLLPPAVVSQELQIKKIMHNLRQYQVPLQRYMAMMDLQERNERLFYKLLIDNVEELLPVVYTPTVGEACQKYGSIFRQPQGLYVSLRDKGRVLEVLRNWPQRDIQVICVTDGERILGLGDLGCQGMGIPVGKLALYTALGGVRPSACLPITIDVGTNNEKLLNDEFYIGLRQKRATGKEYDELMEEFMAAIKQIYGEKVLIQGTASVVLAGLLAALKMVGGTLAEQTYLFLGAGEAGTGIAELIALEISKQTKAPIEECRKKVWLVDSKSIKPTVLIGTSGVGRTFTKEVVEAMASFNEGRAVFASGSPFAPVEYDGKTFVPGQSNNAYIFPGLGLGLVISGAVRVHEDMLLAASAALADQATEENFVTGSIFPPFTNIRKISAHIAAAVAAKAYELGLATRLPPPRDLVKYAESCMYTPVYRNYR